MYSEASFHHLLQQTEKNVKYPDLNPTLAQGTNVNNPSSSPDSQSGYLHSLFEASNLIRPTKTKPDRRQCVYV